MKWEYGCPLPSDDSGDLIRIAHGGGGRAMNDLLHQHILPACQGHQAHDAAVLDFGSVRLAFTTDSYVVDPLFFPGGDIGCLAVYGTVNDLAMAGAAPHDMSLALIMEEGLPISTLDRVMNSIHTAAERTGIRIVTGDTKVVERGKGDGLYINTSGIGRLDTNLRIEASSIREGDAIILSGDLGRHGMAIMAARETLKLDSALESCCAPLWAPVSALLSNGVEVHCLRDLTRGGLAAALNELAQASGLGMEIRETTVKVCTEVHAICEILGFDPLHVANEGRFAAFVPQHQADLAIELLSTLAPDAAVIGHVHAAPAGQVVLENTLGVRRQLPILSGEQLPRIC